MDDERREDDYFVSLPPRAPEDPTAPPPGAGVTPPRGPSIVTVVAVLLGAAALTVGAVAWILSAPGTPLAVPATPSPGAAAADTAAAVEQPRDPATDGYLVWARNVDGSAVRWDPCEPIRWVLNPEDAPPGTALDLTRAVGEITATTGLRFRYLGTTDEQPARDRSPYQPQRYGDGAWAPVLVAWSSPAGTDVPLADTDRGVSIPVAVGDGEEDAFVTGQVVFNPDRPLIAGFDDRRTSWGATILHELGHTVGLDHVDDPAQLMFTFPGEGAVRFGPGDLRGLRELGQGGCLDVPDPVDVDVTYVDDFGR